MKQITKASILNFIASIKLYRDREMLRKPLHNLRWQESQSK